MDPQLPDLEDAPAADQPALAGPHPSPRARRAGGRPRPDADYSSLATHLIRAIRHFFPQWAEWLDQVPEPRDPELLVYPRCHLVWAGILMFLMHLRSRHQWTCERLSSGLTRNLTRLAGLAVDTVAHADTVVRFLARVPPAVFSRLRAQLIHRLIRMRTLDAFRLHGHLLVAVDATEIWTQDTPHCPYCLRRRLSNGKIQYYHSVLEAKWVTANGLALSMATEFIQNDDGRATEELSEEQRKQDCERKAFPRLARQLARFYPQTKLCLLLDALYQSQPALDVCVSHHWAFIITCKEGAAPAFWAEACALAALQAPTHPPRTLRRPARSHATFTWATEVPFGPYALHVIWCDERRLDGTRTRFAWMTCLPVGPDSVVELAEGGGRLRWTIENQGFREQKHGGFALEHVYCHNPAAAQSLYCLLQIAHLLQQVIWAGDLLKDLKPALKTVRTFIRRLCDALHHATIPPDEQLPPLGQVRWLSG